MQYSLIAIHVCSILQDADDFEKSWLLLADVYIQVSTRLAVTIQQSVSRRLIFYVKFSVILVMFPLDVLQQTKVVMTSAFG